jgi:hypothetical protein
MIGQLHASSLFAGFKYRNSKAYDNMSGLKRLALCKQRRCCYAHHYYASLYKAQKTVELLKENQKSAQREFS